MHKLSQYKTIAVIIFFYILPANVLAQLPDYIYKSNITTVRLHPYGNQTALPIYTINSNNQLELHFDDLEGNVKNYYYTYQLCDYNWLPVNLNPFDYIKGFTQQRIGNYRYSSIAFTKYTHYQVILPEKKFNTNKKRQLFIKSIFRRGYVQNCFYKKVIGAGPKNYYCRPGITAFCFSVV